MVAALALGLSLALAGCFSRSSTPPAASRQQIVHTVRPGETLYQISQRYGVSIQSLMTANGVSDSRELRAGQRLLIPGTYSYASLGGFADHSSQHPARYFSWPVSHGVVSSGFGMRRGTMHDGVDIAAPVGTRIHAAGSGVVIYAGRLRGYGRVVIIRHDDHYVTVYAHESADLVSEGQQVARGQMIGEVGRSGRTTGANLHFEVRRDNIAQNPLAYLPSPAESAGISFARDGGSEYR